MLEADLEIMVDGFKMIQITDSSRQVIEDRHSRLLANRRRCVLQGMIDLSKDTGTYLRIYHRTYLEYQC